MTEHGGKKAGESRKIYKKWGKIWENEMDLVRKQGELAENWGYWWPEIFAYFCRFSVIFPSCPHDFLHSFLRNLLRIFWEWDGLGGKTREIDGNIDDRKFELGLYGMLWECMGVYGILWDLLWFIGIYWDFMGFYSHLNYFCKLTSDFCLLRISLQDIARLSMHKKYDIA